MNDLIKDVLSYVPEQWRKFVPLFIAVLLLLLMFLPNLFGENSGTVKDILQSQYEMMKVTATP